MITETKLVDNKQLREQYIDKLEVLDKVKELLLIPKLKCMTTQQVAEYYEVDLDIIKKCYQRNNGEFISDGAKKYSLSNIRCLIGTRCPYLKTTNYRGKMEVEFDKNTKLIIPNTGIVLYPKRAILRMGMLLRDSPVAKEIRTQLLNITENVEKENPELLTKEIETEQGLYMNIGKAFATGDLMEFAKATKELTDYQNRHIIELENKNKELSAEKEILAADILKWSDRASANKLIRTLSGYLRKSFGETYGIIYKELLYKYHINIKARGDKPWIQHLKDSEWSYLYKIVAALCETNSISITKLFKEAKIDVSDLCL